MTDEPNPVLGTWADLYDVVDLNRLSIIMAHDYDEARRAMSFEPWDFDDELAPEFAAMKVVAIKAARWLAELTRVVGREPEEKLREVANEILDFYVSDHAANGQGYSADVVDEWRTRIEKAGR